MDNEELIKRITLGDILEMIEGIIWKTDFLSKEQKQKLIDLFKFGTEGERLRCYITNYPDLSKGDIQKLIYNCVDNCKKELLDKIITTIKRSE